MNPLQSIVWSLSLASRTKFLAVTLKQTFCNFLFMSDILVTEGSLDLISQFFVCVFTCFLSIFEVRIYYFFAHLGFTYQIQSIDVLSRYLCFNIEMLFSLNWRWFLHDDDATNNLLRLPSVPLVFGTWSVHAHCTRVWLISDKIWQCGTSNSEILFVVCSDYIFNSGSCLVSFFFSPFLRICYPQQHRKMHNSGF